MSYTAETVRYFLDNLRTTQRLSPSLFPSFFDYEVFNGVKYAGFRMHAGYIFVSQGEYFFTNNRELRRPRISCTENLNSKVCTA